MNETATINPFSVTAATGGTGYVSPTTVWGSITASPTYTTTTLPKSEKKTLKVTTNVRLNPSLYPSKADAYEALKKQTIKKLTEELSKHPVFKIVPRKGNKGSKTIVFDIEIEVVETVNETISS